MVQNLHSRFRQPTAIQLKLSQRHIDEFWAGPIQAAAYLGHGSIRINALKRCPRLAEAKL